MLTKYQLQRQQMKLTGKAPEPPKKQVPIKPYSNKRQKANKEYSREAKPKWVGKPCAIKSPVCTNHAEGFNHANGKETIEKLLDLANGQPACNACNEYCESHHQWAVENGFRVKRNTESKRNKN
jgi:hypothetical protein